MSARDFVKPFLENHAWNQITLRQTSTNMDEINYNWINAVEGPSKLFTYKWHP